MDKKKRPTKKNAGSVSPVISRQQEKRTVYLLSAALILVVFITFFPVVHHEFVNWDDDQNVYENHLIDNLSAENIRAIFTTPVLGNYNPLPILTFAIEKQFFGLDPGMYHLDNLLLHILNTLLVFFLARGLGLRLPGAFLLALLFGIQPMRVESVAWVTERKDVLLYVGFPALLYPLARQRKKEMDRMDLPPVYHLGLRQDPGGGFAVVVVGYRLF